MSPIVFRAEAMEDLQRIVAWYEAIAEGLSSPILSDIRRSLDQIRHYPRSGMQVPGRKYRRIVTLKYHFKIAYHLAADRIEVLGVFRYQDRQA